MVELICMNVGALGITLLFIGPYVAYQFGRLVEARETIERIRAMRGKTHG